MPYQPRRRRPLPGLRHRLRRPRAPTMLNRIHLLTPKILQNTYFRRACKTPRVTMLQRSRSSRKTSVKQRKRGTAVSVQCWNPGHTIGAVAARQQYERPACDLVESIQGRHVGPARCRAVPGAYRVQEEHMLPGVGVVTSSPRDGLWMVSLARLGRLPPAACASALCRGKDA